MAVSSDESLGELIRRYRLTVAISQEELAERSGRVLFPFDTPDSERVRQRSRVALGEQRFAELHNAARFLGPADSLQLEADVVERTAP